MTTEQEAMIDRLVEEAQQQGSAASELEPTDGTWGFFSYGDAPPAIGGGIGSFLWFASREELLDYLGRLLPFLAPGPGEADHLAVAAAGEAIVRRFAAGELAVDAMLVELNQALRRFSQVCWLGRFGELKTADVEWVRQLRSSFREDDEEADESSLEAPIRASEAELFLDYVRGYGF